MNASAENINRIMYINQNGELFLQFRPDDKASKMKASIEVLHESGTTVHYQEHIGEISIEGVVTRVTKTGIALKDWRIG